MFKVAKVISVTSVDSKDYDCIVVVAHSYNDLKVKYEVLHSYIKPLADIDKSLETDGAFIPTKLPSKCLIFSPTGPLNRDYDDVRRFFDAAVSGIKKAIKSGRTSPLLVVVPSKFEFASLVTLLGALHAVYVPLEIREGVPAKKTKVEKLGFIGDQSIINLALGIESGKTVARDIGGSDPERMAAPRVEEYVQEQFTNSSISMEVISDDNQLMREYPLFSAVNRCAKHVPRHKGRIIYLTYEGKEQIKKTLLIVGKGVTYDTGGADIKAGGIMKGMHRDKCGSAAVAGFMKVLDLLKPSGIKVIGGMAMVRNSVGSECYVSDELFTSRAGKRVRINNTDAEGRLAMADVLCRMKELAQKEVDPSIFTIATLTGHVCRTYGSEYSAVMDNGPAEDEGIARNIQTCGHGMADPLEVSTIRREDYKTHEGVSDYEDLRLVDDNSSVKTPRGHQSPAAFMIMAAGLDKHGKDSEHPLKYTHIDIAGSAGPFPGIPSAAPITALTKTFLPSLF